MVSGVKARPHGAAARQRDYAGVNLVAEDHDSGLWPVQATAYTPFHAIRKATWNV